MGVATSLDSHIEQLMDQHGWTDRATACSAALSARGMGGGDAAGADAGGGSGDISFLDFGAGALRFGGGAAAKGAADVEGDSSSQGGGGAARQGGGGEAVASPGVAEKAAAGMAALLPSGFRPKESVSEFLSEVQ